MTDNNSEDQNTITGLLVSFVWEHGMVRLDIIPNGAPERWAAGTVGTNITLSTEASND